MEGEQFSLCWNNFHSNLSSGFHSLLKDEDLVDVTLAAEGRYLKAHKIVLSICSPYFKELFRVNPCKHPIVILQDVNYAALCNLLQFMYQGEVSVSQEEIPIFMRVAEMLKVKGLTDNRTDTNGVETGADDTQQNYSSEPKQPLKRPKPMKKVIKPSQARSFGERSPAARQINSPQPERYTQAKHAKVDDGNMSCPETQVSPIHPKQEPLDDSTAEYSEIGYDEHMDVSSMLDTTLGEPSKFSPLSFSSKFSSQDASSPGGLLFLKSRKGHPVLIHNGHIYTLSHKRENRSTWLCVKQRILNCEGCVITTNGPMLLSYSGHNHAQLHDVIHRLQASSCSPSPELS